MTAKIKLNAASGGGSFSLQAPSSSSNNRVMTLPDTADGTILTTTNPKSGNILQVVATNFTGTSSVSVSDASLSDTPASVTITSTAANSKFLISATMNGEGSVPDHDYAYVLRRFIGGSGASIAVGGSAGSRSPVSFMQSVGYYGNDQDSTPSTSVLAPYLDSPSQAAGTAITYKVAIMGVGSSGQFYFGYTAVNTENSGNERGINFITVMEVAA